MSKSIKRSPSQIILGDREHDRLLLKGSAEGLTINENQNDQGKYESSDITFILRNISSASSYVTEVESLDQYVVKMRTDERPPYFNGFTVSVSGVYRYGYLNADYIEIVDSGYIIKPFHWKLSLVIFPIILISLIVIFLFKYKI